MVCVWYSESSWVGVWVVAGGWWESSGWVVVDGSRFRGKDLRWRLGKGWG